MAIMNKIVAAGLLGLVAMAGAQPVDHTSNAGGNGNGNANGLSMDGNPNNQQLPAVDPVTPQPGLPGAPEPENADQLAIPGISTFAHGGSGCWNFDYNYLGCADSTLNCNSPVYSRYSPESSAGYLQSPGGTLQVRLWGPYEGANYDLYIEEYINGRWVVVQQSAQTGTWKESVSFNTRAGSYYRFRAYHRSGSGFYTLSWKF